MFCQKGSFIVDNCSFVTDLCSPNCLVMTRNDCEKQTILRVARPKTFCF